MNLCIIDQCLQDLFAHTGRAGGEGGTQVQVAIIRHLSPKWVASPQVHQPGIYLQCFLSNATLLRHLHPCHCNKTSYTKGNYTFPCVLLTSPFSKSLCDVTVSLMSQVMKIASTVFDEGVGYSEFTS